MSILQGVSNGSLLTVVLWPIQEFTQVHSGHIIFNPTVEVPGMQYNMGAISKESLSWYIKGLLVNVALSRTEKHRSVGLGPAKARREQRVFMSDDPILKL